MKKTVLTYLFFSLCVASVDTYAQDSQKKVKLYKSWIYTIDDQNDLYKKIGPVTLLEIKDSSVVIRKSLTMPESDIPVFNIILIKTKKKNSVVKGLLIGAVSGFAIGGLIGLASGDDPEDEFLAWTAEEKALILGAYFATAGTGIGAVYGATFRFKIPINGDIELFKRNKDKLRKFAIVK